MNDQPSPLFERIRFKGHPAAHPDSVIISGQARFTFLTSRLVRLEWSATGEFKDRGTFAFPTRYAAPPGLSVRMEGETQVISTSAVTLRYRPEGRFAANNLEITFQLDEQTVIWRPGMANTLNLRGARRTLDGCEGDAALDEGILSRAGWSCFDDSKSVLFNPEDGWVTARPDHDLQDWYFFAYGHDYQGALAEYTLFGGDVPLIPRFVLGGWWSRYWDYSDRELQDLIGEFEAHDVPLDVLVIDMGWHTPHAWTGYTWNRELFPDPSAFLKWVHDKGLKVTLNLHPAQGVQSFEEVYPAFAQAMGMDPADGDAVPFRIADKRFVQNYFELIHHPMEDQGVDFWWMDWQQGEISEVKGLDPLGWINHLHFNDSRRRGLRPMLYSRWGGLGNHRYHIGFSGDTIVGWSALQFQPYMTAAGANVAYGWWSHDIGGHMGGATEPELYARWVQFGALSPCLRLHSTKDPRCERRPWAYPENVYRAAQAAWHFRYQLAPYLYTMARRAADTAISLCRPMYFEHPHVDDAYVGRYQYYLGDQAIAAPIVFPSDPQTGLASTDVWVPAGTWVDYQTLETYTGPCWVRLSGDLNRMPLLVKAGGILPLAPEFPEQQPPRLASGSTDAQPRDWLVLAVFPGDRGEFRLYEDDGITESYRQGQCEWTTIRAHMPNAAEWTVAVAAVEGHCDALPSERGYDILLYGSYQPQVVMLDEAETADWEYNPETLTTIVHVPMRPKSQPVTITAFASSKSSHQMVALGDERNAQLALADVRTLLGDAYPEHVEDKKEMICALSQLDTFSGEQLAYQDAVARLGGPFVRFIELVTPEEAAQQLGRVIVGGSDSPYDLVVTWTLFQGGGPQTQTWQAQGVTGSQVINAPWAFDGTVQAMHWEARVELRWQGQTLVYTHQSKPAFPTIYAWQGIVYNQQENPLSPDQVVDAQGHLNPSLDWQPFVQTAERLRNINQPHAVILREYGERLRAAEPLAGYFATTILCPEDRQAVLGFRASGEVDWYLNGEKLEWSAEVAPHGPPIFREAIKTSVRLRQGQNVLLAHSRPPTGERAFWFLGGALLTPDDRPMTDLTFVAD